MKDNDRVAAWNYEEVSKNPDWTLQAYIKRGGLIYEDVQVLGVSAIEGDRAKVNVKMVYSVPAVRVKNITIERQDEWVWKEGQWYHADPLSSP